MLSVETDVKGDSKSTNERGRAMVGLLGMSCRYKKCLFCLGSSSGPSTKYFFPTVKLFKFICPCRPQAGQAAVLGRLSLIMLVWSRLYSVHEHAHLCIPHFQLQSADTHTEPVNISLNRRHLVLFLPSLCCKTTVHPTDQS